MRDVPKLHFFSDVNTALFVYFLNFFFFAVGSCFNQLQMQLTNTHRMILEMGGSSGGKVDGDVMKTPSKYVEDFFHLSQRLLSKEMHQALDKLATETYNNRMDKKSSFPYITFNESLTFIVTSLMRELLQSSSGKNCISRIFFKIALQNKKS